MSASRESSAMMHASAHNPHSSSSHSAPAMAMGSGRSNVTEIELMRTILGEHVPQSVILACLNACAFDVTAALNWYFMEVASHEAEQERAERANAQAGIGTQQLQPQSQATPIIQSGHSLTIHARNVQGMISKTDTYYATLTKGLPTYDMLTPSNEKFLTIKLRKRGWRPVNGSVLGGSGSSFLFGSPSSTDSSMASVVGQQRPYFMNGDIVTLECNGLWLKASSLHKMLQWKSPADDDRCKFVIRGLPLGRNLRPGDYFFLTSYRWGDKEIVMKDEKPVGLTSYNTSVHRSFLGLDRVKGPHQRLYFYAKLTDNAMSSLQKPTDPIDLQFLSIDVIGTPAVPMIDEELLSEQRQSFTSEISQLDAKIDQMVGIVGEEISRERLANFLDGAGGNVQVALEHYFMTISSLEPQPAERQAKLPPSPAPIYVVDESHDHVQAQAEAYAQAQAHAQAQAQAQAKAQAQAEAQATVAAAVAAAAQTHQHNRRPLSNLIIPIPSLAEVEALESPSPRLTLPLPIPVATPAASKEDEETVNAALESALLSSSRSRRGISTDSITLDTTGFAVHDEEPEGLTIHDFEMVSVLGKGSFGAVMLVRFKKDGRIFALKIIKKSNMDRSDIRNAMEERQILQRIHHPYICSLMFAFQTNERLYLGMKYYAAGDLFYHLNMRGQLPVRDAQLYAAELVLAISYLHELNILYRDLKPSNVMIDSDGHIGVVDFGLSKQHIYGSNTGVKTLSGTAEYVAPEALAQMADGSRSYGKAYDWWSLGVVIYEMLVGESPFYDKNEHKMLRKIAYADAVFPSDFPKDALDLVRGLLCKDPANRLGGDRAGGLEPIKRNRFFRGIDWEKLARREVPAYWKPKLSSETDTRYVDPEFIDEGPPSAVMDPSASAKKSFSKRFSQFSFNINLT